jgi:hypothetical protein
MLARHASTKPLRLGMRALLSVLGACVFASLAFANAGVFFGNGQTLELATQQQVQMVSESITISPGRGPRLFDGGAAGADRVSFRCQFVLKNLTGEAVTIQVGFPLDAENERIPSTTAQPASELIANYRFIAQDEQGVYNVTYAPGDRLKKLRHLFLWEMTFAPGETKNLRVDYTMPISFGLVEAVKDTRAAPYAKPWFSELQGALVEEFGYVTVTGAGWAGVIERAEFVVEAAAFEDYIAHRPFIETNDATAKARALARLPAEHPTFLRVYSPDGWQTDARGDHRLVNTDYVPAENLRFRYFLYFFPRTIAELETLLANLKPAPWSAEDYADLRDVYREYNGEKTENPRLADFLNNQLWHGTPPQKPVPASVIDHLSTLAARSSATP